MVNKLNDAEVINLSKMVQQADAAEAPQEGPAAESPQLGLEDAILIQEEAQSSVSKAISSKTFISSL